MSRCISIEELYETITFTDHISPALIFLVDFLDSRYALQSPLKCDVFDVHVQQALPQNQSIFGFQVLQILREIIIAAHFQRLKYSLVLGHS